MIRLTAIVLVVLVAMAAGCRKGEDPLSSHISGQEQYVEWPGLASTPWPMFMHDPQHTGRSSHKGPQNGTVQWRFDAASSVYSSPVIDEDGTIYVGSNDNYLYALNADGTVKWKYMTTGVITSSPLIAADGTIYVAVGTAEYSIPGASNGALFAFDRSGGVKWKFELEGFPSQCAPTISKDGRVVYICSGDAVSHPRKLYAINSDGTLHWTYGGKVGQDKLYIYSPAFSADGTTLYVPGYSKVFAVDTSGKELWQCIAGTGSGISASCVDNAGNIYISCTMAYCLGSDGSVKWTRTLVNSNEPPMPSIGWDGTVFISSGELGPPGGNYIHAYQQGGVLKWMQFVGGVSQGHPVSDIDGTVYVGSDGRFADPARTAPDSSSIFAINADGTYKFRLILRSPDGSVPDVSSTPAIGLENKIYVGCDRPHGTSIFAIN